MMLGDVMTRDVLTTSPDDTVAAAARAMTDREVGSACVLAGSGELRGIITERDVLRAAASGRDLASEPVTEWMTPEPVTAGPGEVPSEIATIMRERGFRHLPVLEGGELAGIVSMRDLWGFVFLPSEPDDMTLR